MASPGRPFEEFYDKGFREILVTEKKKKTKYSTATSPGSKH